jgi:hypothetical protein
MAILVVIFAVLVAGIVFLTFRTTGNLEKSEKAIEELRRQIDL